ncbi:MAG: HRDC domain-containing protein [Kiritimatiellae bacterium]|jgi:ribonuclease D|nr:HRDC domain-containing protein [Kiritimatiellia bacterium]
MAHGAELITTAKGLEDVAARLLDAEAVAVDTEFFWERTYYPVLGLVQLATEDGCWLADAVALGDLRALGPVLAARGVVKLLHDAPQDLGILARATGALPRTVFDTRVAAGFAGFSSTGSLQALLRDALGVELAKAETRSDWLRRPLSEGQLRYAAEDVIHLIPLRAALLARCAGDTERAWLTEELARLDDASLYGDRDPRLMYQRVKGGSRLDPRQLAVLRELAAWREEEARQRDWPRGHVLPDTLLTAIAQRSPATLDALKAVPEFPYKMPASVAARLLDAVTQGLAVQADACPQPSGLDFAAKRELKSPCDRLLAHIKAACEPHGIDPALVASRADAEAYVSRRSDNATADCPLSRGWRHTLTSGFMP